MITTHHWMGGLLLLWAAGDGGRGGDHDKGEGPRHLAEGGADVVHRLAAQLEAVNLENLVCNIIIIIIINLENLVCNIQSLCEMMA